MRIILTQIMFIFQFHLSYLLISLIPLFFQKFIQRSDQDQSGDIKLAEFVHYVREHEKNLKLQFSHLDKNRDGKVDLEELISAFKDLGIEMDKNEALKLLHRFE